VTINEYIEISKNYSTPRSKQFVNGILDVLANELSSEGIIKKSGRGLIDNK
jgi:N utilization substance protein B